MIYLPRIEPGAAADARSLNEWFAELISRINAELGSGQRYQYEVAGENGVRVGKWTHGIVAKEQLIGPDFFASAEYQQIAILGQQLDGLLAPG